jgi:uncharacterized protein YjbI with pentapeptide repeats
VEDGEMSAEVQRPTSNDDQEAWKAYWKAQGMPWRTEPEIGEERQAYLAERIAVKPDMEKGIYPFRDENGSIKLTRADIEWLLATHQDGRGPVVFGQTDRIGLDLRGTNLRGLDLSRLPLAGTLGGLDILVWNDGTPEHVRLAEMAALHLEDAHLNGVQLWWAMLDGAHLEGADLMEANLYLAKLRGAHLEEATLFLANLEANLHLAHLEGADLRFAFFSRGAYLDRPYITSEQHGTFFVADVRWGEVNLSLVNWAQVHMLGEEEYARSQQRQQHQTQFETKKIPGEPKDRQISLYSQAVRAYRQLAMVLRGQGLNEYADQFAYRAQLCQRHVQRLQRHFGRAIGSWLLDAISGYGYKPMRSFITYVLVILGFAAAYFILGGANGQHLAWNEAVVISMTAFHGRGFFAAVFQPSDPQAAVAAVEAFIGLLIEIVFIATFTQRFFAR